MEDPKKVIAKAADIIEAKGWTQHQMRADDGSVCAFCALRDAAEELWPGTPNRQSIEYCAARTIIVKHINRGFTGWNDSIIQTKDDVVATMRALAAS